MVAFCKIDNYVLILMRMYWRTFSNSSGNVLKIVSNKNGTKFPYKYGNIYGNTDGSVFYKRIRDTKKLKLVNLNEPVSAYSYILACRSLNSADS